MKILPKLLCLAIISGGLTANSPAKADTAYHAVYHRSTAADDAFSIEDKYQNNALTPEEYNNAANTVAFTTVDTDGDGFISRSEFYAYYQIAHPPQDAAELALMVPAAGGNSDDDDNECR